MILPADRAIYTVYQWGLWLEPPLVTKPQNATKRIAFVV